MIIKCDKNAPISAQFSMADQFADPDHYLPLD